MKSTRFSFNISAKLVEEDVKRYWLIPAMIFLIYFIVGAVPLLDAADKYISVSLNSQHNVYANSIQIALISVSAISAAASVFSYLHGKASSVFVHGLPFSRKTLFRSHAFAGWLLAVFPIVISGLCFIVVCALQTASGKEIIESPDVYIPISYVDYYLDWTLSALIAVTFVYALALLAGVIAGNLAVHVLLAMFLNGIAPVTVFLVNNYLFRFLKGFTAPPLGTTDFSPLLRFYGAWEYFNKLLYCGAYIAFSLLFIFLAAALYKRLPLERSGDTVFFPAAGKLVCLLFAFIGMALFGLSSIRVWGGDTTARSLCLALIGSLLFYLIGRMILEKRLQVFHRETLKGYCLFLVFAAVFCSFTIFDVTGFETRVPNASQIQSITLSGAAGQSDGNAVYTSLESFEDILALHRAFIEEAEDYDPSVVYDTIYLSYKLKNGKTLERRYEFQLEESDKVFAAYNHLYKSAAYRERLDETVLLRSKIQSLNDQLPGFSDNYDALIEKLPEAILEDAGERSLMQTLYKGQFLADEKYTLRFRFEDGGTWEYYVTTYDKNTLALCEKYLKGYLAKSFTPV